MRWSLCAGSDWREQDGSWGAEPFYSVLMQAFGIGYNESDSGNADDGDEFPIDDEWVNETLTWWNE